MEIILLQRDDFDVAPHLSGFALGERFLRQHHAMFNIKQQGVVAQRDVYLKLDKALDLNAT